jgi:hypothetical protein
MGRTCLTVQRGGMESSIVLGRTWNSTPRRTQVSRFEPPGSVWWSGGCSLQCQPMSMSLSSSCSALLGTDHDAEASLACSDSPPTPITLGFTRPPTAHFASTSRSSGRDGYRIAPARRIVRIPRAGRPAMLSATIARLHLSPQQLRRQPWDRETLTRRPITRYVNRGTPVFHLGATLTCR